MTDDLISRIKAALEAKALTEPATPEEFASAQEWLFIVCPPTTLRYLLDRLKAAEAENERLSAEAVDQKGVLCDLLADASLMKQRLVEAKLEVARLRQAAILPALRAAMSKRNPNAR